MPFTAPTNNELAANMEWDDDFMAMKMRFRILRFTTKVERYGPIQVDRIMRYLDRDIFVETAEALGFFPIIKMEDV